MKLYVDVSAIEKASADLEEIAAVVNLVIEKVVDLDNDMSSEQTRHDIVCALLAVSSLIQQTITETTSAVARAYMSPHDFTGESFKV